MACMSVFGYCYGCKRPFSFNADRVPSIRVNGEREPVCGECVARINAKRKEIGLDPLAVLPGAYGPEECA
jgi:hypothetical protein